MKNNNKTKMSDSTNQNHYMAKPNSGSFEVEYESDLEANRRPTRYASSQSSLRAGSTIGGDDGMDSSVFSEDLLLQSRKEFQKFVREGVNNVYPADNNNDDENEYSSKDDYIESCSSNDGRENLGAQTSVIEENSRNLYIDTCSNSKEELDSFIKSLADICEEKGLENVLIPAGISDYIFLSDDNMRNFSMMICKKWGSELRMDVLKQRLLDFYSAQNFRQAKYGGTKALGIMALYAHLSGIRADIAFAENCEKRRQMNKQPMAWEMWRKKVRKKYPRNKPTFIVSTIAVCTVTFIGCIYENGWKVESFTVNPMIGPSKVSLVNMGAKLTTDIVSEGEWWRIFTSMFLHAGIVHYLFNVSALWMLGVPLEQHFGTYTVTALFVLPGVFGTVLSSLVLPEYPSVSASGCVLGLIGACVADVACNRPHLFSNKINVKSDQYRYHIRVVVFLFLDVVLNVIIGFTPMVDNFTQLGGLVMGFVCRLSIGTRVKGTATGSCWRRVCLAFSIHAGLIMSLLACVAFTSILFTKKADAFNCTRCLPFSCLPFPFWYDDEDKWWTCENLDGDALS